MIELKRGEHRLGLLPETGGSVAHWRFAGRDLLSAVVDPNLRAQHEAGIAAYPLVPYSNRIGNARFTFDGQDFELTNNFGDEPHSIHGNGWERVWDVIQHDDERAILLLDHVPDSDAHQRQWPFAYRCVQSFVVHDSGFDLEMLVVNKDQRPQPVGFGFHPYLTKLPGATLSFDAAGRWENGPDHLPTTNRPLDEAHSFAFPRAVADLRLDTCFSGWSGQAELADPQEACAVTIHADPIFGHLVVFCAPEKPFVALEPVTNMTDAVHHPESVERGLHVVAPGGRLSGMLRFRLEDRRARV